MGRASRCSAAQFCETLRSAVCTSQIIRYCSRVPVSIDSALGADCALGIGCLWLCAGTRSRQTRWPIWRPRSEQSPCLLIRTHPRFLVCLNATFHGAHACFARAHQCLQVIASLAGTDITLLAAHWRLEVLHTFKVSNPAGSSTLGVQHGGHKTCQRARYCPPPVLSTIQALPRLLPRRTTRRPPASVPSSQVVASPTGRSSRPPARGCRAPPASSPACRFTATRARSTSSASIADSIRCLHVFEGFSGAGTV